MNHNDTAFELLLTYANEIPIVDAHEHFISEAAHLKRYLSFFDFITSYIQWDLYSAGLPRELVWKYPQNQAEETALFEAIEPLWKYVRHGSYARPIRLALKEFYGVDDLTRENYLMLGQVMNQQNRKGHYDLIFDKANIRTIINQSVDLTLLTIRASSMAFHFSITMWQN